MRTVTLSQPARIVFGAGCSRQYAEDARASGFRSVFLVTGSPLRMLVQPLVAALEGGGCRVDVFDRIDAEPTSAAFGEALDAARSRHIDAVVGIGGGSALDVAKLVAGLAHSGQALDDVFGINLLGTRRIHLACIPTTAGTGSEVSPNAILLDEKCRLKKAVVSPHLVPDAAYVDPELTWSLPPAATAATGMDALSHCIESYANVNAHPAVDLYALEGIRRIGSSLLRAVSNGRDAEARENLALGSLYGGLCLGPVNTAAAHALAYPLGSGFHVAHGISIAVLLPHVLRFNVSAQPDRYAAVAVALGVEPEGADEQTACRGVERVAELCEQCGIPAHLSALGIPREILPAMAESAITITRLLKNNPRSMTVGDIERIYEAAY